MAQEAPGRSKQVKRGKTWWERKPVEGALLASGGIDSTVLMYWLAKKRLISNVILIDSGQASIKKQRDLVKDHASILTLTYSELKVPIPYYAQRSEIAIPGYSPSPRKDVVKEVPALLLNSKTQEQYMDLEFAWIEGRNALWMIQAGIWAACNGVQRIYTGFQFDKPWWKSKRLQTGDTSPGFIESMNFLSQDAFQREVQYVAPFLDWRMDKAEIAEMGRKLEVSLDRTYSCEFFPACGECFQCAKAKEVIPHKPLK